MKKLYEERDYEDPVKFRALFEDEIDGKKIYFISEKDGDFGYSYGVAYLYYGFSIPQVLEEFVQKDGIENYFSVGSHKFATSIVEKYKEEFDKLDPPDRNEFAAKADYAHKRYELAEDRHDFYEKKEVKR